jgi:hypothetical protein
MPSTRWMYHQGGANEISVVFFWKRGRWSLHVAVVSQLVSGRVLLKGSGGHAADCIVYFILKTLCVSAGILPCTSSVIYF